MSLWDTRSKRLAVAAGTAALMLVAAFAFAATGSTAPSSRRVPTIVSDRPIQDTAALAAGAGLATASRSQPPSAAAMPTAPPPQAAAPAATSAARPSSTTSARSTRRARTAVSSSEGRDGGTSGEHHEVVEPKIRDDDTWDEPEVPEEPDKPHDEREGD